MPSPQNSPREDIGSVIGGNWSFSVSNGKLQNFAWNVKAYTLSGDVNGTFSISKLNDVPPISLSGPSSTTNASSIQLYNNVTSLKGTGDIVINDKPTYTNVPMVLTLL